MILPCNDDDNNDSYCYNKNASLEIRGSKYEILQFIYTIFDKKKNISLVRVYSLQTKGLKILFHILIDTTHIYNISRTRTVTCQLSTIP